MKAERVILSFIAILVGLFAAGVAFYIYQSTRTIPSQSAKPISIATPTPVVTPVSESADVLTISAPKDEEVSTKKAIKVSGKTTPGATIVVSSEDADQIAEPTASGDFSLTVTIPDGTSILRITSISPTGAETVENRVVTFSTENF